MSKVTLDVATPKQAILATALYNELRKKFEVEVIARRETQTIEILHYLKTPFVEIGEYGGESLINKLKAEFLRGLSILSHFMETGFPSALWTHGSVSGCRVAFGLKIPIIYSNDTLHAEHVLKLTVPLARYLIIPEAYDEREWSKYGLSIEKIVKFRGVEELAWIKDLRINRERVLKKYLGRVVDRLVVVRGIEYMASYSLGVRIDLTPMLRKLAEYATIVYLPRYEEEKFKYSRCEEIVVPEKTIYAPELIAAADLVISSGGTMCSEAALLGIPVINYYFYTPITEYLIKKGLPIKYILDLEKVYRESIRILRDPDSFKVDTSDIVKSMESPIPRIIECVESVLK